MRTLTFAILAALILAACGDGDYIPPPPYRFRITSLDKSSQKQFTQAAQAWNVAAGELLILIDPNGQNIASFGKLPHGVAGRGTQGGNIVFSDSADWSPCTDSFWGQIFGADFRAVAAHEMGHVLGARFNNPGDTGHSRDPDDLMNPGGKWCALPSQADVDAIPWK